MLQRLVGCNWLARGDQHYIVPLLFPGATFTWFTLSYSDIPNNIALTSNENWVQLPCHRQQHQLDVRRCRRRSQR